MGNDRICVRCETHYAFGDNNVCRFCKREMEEREGGVKTSLPRRPKEPQDIADYLRKLGAEQRAKENDEDDAKKSDVMDGDEELSESEQRDKNIKEFIEQGWSAPQIQEQLHLANPSRIYTVAKKEGLKVTNAWTKKKEGNESKATVAKKLGVRKDNVVQASGGEEPKKRGRMPKAQEFTSVLERADGKISKEAAKFRAAVYVIDGMLQVLLDGKEQGTQEFAIEQLNALKAYAPELFKA